MMTTTVLVFIVLTFSVTLHMGHSKDCKFTVNKSPLVLKKRTHALIIPKGRNITLRDREQIGLSCTDGNKIIGTTSSLTYATCNGSSNSLNIFQGKQGEIFDEIKCRSTIRGDVWKTDTPCAMGRGQLSYIGYSIEGNFYPVITVCYDYGKGNALFSKHDLQGKLIEYTSLKTSRPNFSTSGLPSTINAEEVYKQSTQKKVFKETLGSDLYIKGHSFLARSHLTPDADFVYDVFQRFTYFYVNVCHFPHSQWQAINNGNWKSIEISIRKAAANYSDTFTIVTGTHEILSLKDIHGKEKEIFLLDNQFPVPKYIWKIVYNKSSKKAIALVILNNPHPEEDPELCNDICDKYGWGSKNWKIPSKGYVQCCDLSSFAEIVQTAPTFTVNGVLPAVK